jgi:hypothetical protein
VGYSWCGWIDGWKTHQKEKRHSGFQNSWGEYCRSVTAAMARLCARMYDIAAAAR